MAKVADNILFRVYFLFGAVCLFALLILFRLVKIQYFEQDKWTATVTTQLRQEEETTALRGNILSDDGRILATSQLFYKIAIDPSQIRPSEYHNFEASLDTLNEKLTKKFGDHDQEAYYKNKIKRAIAAGSEFIYLTSKSVDYQEFQEMKQWPILKNKPFEGGLLNESLNNTRFYPFGSLAKITLGILKDDSVPLRGLEYAFHQSLKGQKGKKIIQKIGRRKIPVDDPENREAIDGADIFTTINIEIQDKVESALANAVRLHEAKYGVAILMEVKTGHIKAIANYPENLNRAVANRIEPGSTFKLAAAIALLEDGEVSLSDSVDVSERLYFYKREMRDHLHLKKLTFEQGFEKSSNKLFAKLIDKAYKNQPEKFIFRLKQMRLDQAHLSHIQGTPRPILVQPADSAWSGTTLPWMSIGYNIQLTPLQILTFYNAIANNGIPMRPQLVTQVKRRNEVLESYAPEVLGRAYCSASTLKKVHRMLEGVVEEGTAKKIKSDKFKMAGKTGTAKKVINGEYRNIYQASFCGYFPAENPIYSCYILIDSPSDSAIYGAEVAAPVFKKIADQLYAMDPSLSSPKIAEAPNWNYDQKIYHKNATAIASQLPIGQPAPAKAAWGEINYQNKTPKYKNVSFSTDKVPNVKGMSARDALHLLESLGLKVEIEGHGKVYKQSIAQGTILEPRTTIVIGLR